MRTFIACMVVMVFFIGCSDPSTDVDVIEKKQLFPLSVGNYWNYRLYQYDSLGRITDSTSVYPEKIVRDTVIQNITWSLMSVKVPMTIIEIPYANESDGFHIWSDNSSKLVLKYPALVNEVFGDSMKVIAVDQPVTTAAGVFNCIVYQRTTYDASWKLWNYEIISVSPGVGKIKDEYLISKDNVNRTVIGGYYLESYKLF